MYDLESAHNLKDVNNTQAMGYDNIIETGAANTA